MGEMDWPSVVVGRVLWKAYTGGVWRLAGVKQMTGGEFVMM